MPGTPGAKEAYGICTINMDFTVTIPPKAINRYELTDNDFVIVTTARRGESGFALIGRKKAEGSIFKKYMKQIKESDVIKWFNKRAYIRIQMKNRQIRLNKESLEAFKLKIGDQLIAVKATTVSLSFSPVEIWKQKLAKHGFIEAIKNIDNLEFF